MGRKTVEILTAARLSYVLTSVQATEFEKVFLVVFKNLKLFLNTFSAYDKYSVRNKEYLRLAIHMRLSQKQKIFSNVFVHFSNLH